MPEVQVAGMASAQFLVRSIGSGMLAAIMREPRTVAHLPKQKLMPEIKLNGKYHIYDTLNKKYLGFHNAFKYGFLPESQALFTLLPYKAEKVLCNVKRTGRKVVMEIALDAQSRKFCDHTFRVDIFDADGKKNDSYSSIVYSSGRSGKYEFSLPLNKKRVHLAFFVSLITRKVKFKQIIFFSFSHLGVVNSPA